MLSRLYSTAWFLLLVNVSFGAELADPPKPECIAAPHLGARACFDVSLSDTSRGVTLSDAKVEGHDDWQEDRTYLSDTEVFVWMLDDYSSLYVNASYSIEGDAPGYCVFTLIVTSKVPAVHLIQESGLRCEFTQNVAGYAKHTFQYTVHARADADANCYGIFPISKGGCPQPPMPEIPPTTQPRETPLSLPIQREAVPHPKVLSLGGRRFGSKVQDFQCHKDSDCKPEGPYVCQVICAYTDPYQLGTVCKCDPIQAHVTGVFTGSLYTEDEVLIREGAVVKLAWNGTGGEYDDASGEGPSELSTVSHAGPNYWFGSVTFYDSAKSFFQCTLFTHDEKTLQCTYDRGGVVFFRSKLTSVH